MSEIPIRVLQAQLPAHTGSNKWTLACMIRALSDGYEWEFLSQFTCKQLQAFLDRLVV